ncbi:MAG: hypothetical protein JXA55_00315 [Bacteroidales bacterium]|nr:hypothetical protein [Bacteroidales bacterium]
MKLPLKVLILAAYGIILSGTSGVYGQYSNHKEIISSIRSMAAKHPSLCTAATLAKTEGGKDIMVLTIGTGDKDNKPGIAVIGGVTGSHPAGRELALGFASNLLGNASSEEIKTLLGEVTFYVVPDLSPDATEQYFMDIKYERHVNARKVDDDRDFRFDEDPAEDLNKDGYITLIRVSDPAGTYIESKEDKRIMVSADLAKGEKGAYLVYPEGIDNDKDGKFNEDGQGGVNFNRNLTYNYEEFGSNAGLHAVSEPETMALVDFLFDRYNIYATFTFGPQDNLTQTSRGAERSPQAQGQQAQSSQAETPGQGRRMGSRKITSVQRTDEVVMRYASEKYREITGLKGSAQPVSDPGNFADWAYYHYGRYSFSTPGWWFPVERNTEPGVAFLKFAEEQGMKDAFVAWTEIEHPDFPGKKVEVGGIKPFVMMNPPADRLSTLAEAHYKFIVAMAEEHPELEFSNIKTEDEGEGIFRVTINVHNKGIFATCAEAGQNNIFTRIMRLSLQTSKGQTLLSGQQVQRIPRITGDGVEEFSWLISGKGTLKITAGAANTGFINTSVELK